MIAQVTLILCRSRMDICMVTKGTVYIRRERVHRPSSVKSKEEGKDTEDNGRWGKLAVVRETTEEIR